MLKKLYLLLFRFVQCKYITSLSINKFFYYYFTYNKCIVCKLKIKVSLL